MKVQIKEPSSKRYIFIIIRKIISLIDETIEILSAQVYISRLMWKHWINMKIFYVTFLLICIDICTIARMKRSKSWFANRKTNLERLYEFPAYNVH